MKLLAKSPTIHLIGALSLIQLCTYSYGREEDQALSSIPLVFALALIIIAKSKVWASVLRNDKRFRYANISVGLTILFAWTSGLFISDSFQNSILGSLNRGDGLVVFSLFLVSIPFCMQMSSEESKILLLWLVFSIGFVSVVGLVQIFNNNIFNPLNYEGVVGTFLNTNTAAAFFAFSALILLMLAQANSNKGYRVSLFLGFGITTILAVETETAQAPIIIGVGILSIALMKILSKLNFRAQNLRWGIYGSVALTFVAGFVAVPAVLAQLISVETFKYRLIYWKTGWNAFIDNWLFGVGYANFDTVVRTYREQNYVEELGANLVVDDPHSIPIWLLINLGVLGLFTLATAAYLLARYSFKSLKFQGGSKVIWIRRSLYIPILIWSSISYIQVEVIFIVSIFVIAFLRAFSEPAANKSSGAKSNSLTPASTALVLVGTLLYTIATSGIPEKLSMQEGVEIVKSDNYRCEYRVQILNALQEQGKVFTSDELREIANLNLNCGSISQGIYKYLISLGEEIKGSEITLLRQSDPYNPEVLAMSMIVAARESDFQLFTKVRNLLDKFANPESQISPELQELLKQSYVKFGLTD